MKKAVFAILVVFVVAAGGILVAASMQPDEFMVERSITTNAEPSAVYAILSDLGRFSEWSPWEKLDPNMKKTLTGEAGAIGAELSWVGNENAGSGKMTITDLVPNEQVDARLEFIEPMPGVSNISWVIGGDDATKITWRMSGENDTMLAKVVCLFLDMDRLLGKDFEDGLANLAALAEKG